MPAPGPPFGREGRPLFLHVVLGESAAGSLRAACASLGLPGSVFGIPDDLSHGPLGDGVERLEFMRDCFRGYDEWTLDRADAFAPWDDLALLVGRDRPGAVAIWAGQSASEATFLAMACWRLSRGVEPLLHVDGPAEEWRGGLGAYAPAELLSFWGGRRSLSGDERQALALEFERLRDGSGLLRRLEGGAVRGVPLDTYDGLLLAACPGEFTPAARVVGDAMGSCDAGNPMSDLFFASRLRHLVESGLVEAEGPRERLRDYAVRKGPRAAGPGGAGPTGSPTAGS